MTTRISSFVLTSVAVALFAAAYVHLQAAATPQAPVPDKAGTPAQVSAAAAPAPSSQRAFLNRYCVGCHNERMKANFGGLALDTLDPANAGAHAEIWEKVVRKVSAGVMPPAGRPHPEDSVSAAFLSSLERELDRATANPGRTASLHRLNRTEYQHAIYDLLALDVDVAALLPGDDSSFGFDNMGGSLRISPSLLERYLRAATRISDLAIGGPVPDLDVRTYRVIATVQQHSHVEGLPLGTRGGTLIQHQFPYDGEYDITAELLGGGSQTDELEILLDSESVHTFPKAVGGGREGVGTKLTTRVSARAGARGVGVTFRKPRPDLVEALREPFLNPNYDGGPGGDIPYVASVTVSGPYNPTGPGDTPSRRRIFVCRPASVSEEKPCAGKILANLARRAYRGFVAEPDVRGLLALYEQARSESGNFDAGIEMALRRLLVSPEFLFRVEADPRVAAKSSEVYRIGDLELASRLSFFLWSSIPDDELLGIAARGKLRDPIVLEQQVKRMLTDPRSEALATNFAEQWLLTRNLDKVLPGESYAVAFDETLRQSLRHETEMFVDSIVKENRGALELLTATYSFLNERVAVHYGVPNVLGTHFRRVEFPADNPRRGTGIMGHGSVLTVTSHAIRTSPVIRGKWLLTTILGTPPPDPPPNVPALVDVLTQAKTQTMRERMAEHRNNPSCAACHNVIDPAGFALENFDAIGRWRDYDESLNALDTSGALPDGTKFNGVVDLRAALVRRPERFVTTFVERLLTYALGRGVEYYDMPTVRKIVRDAAPVDYKLHSIVLNIVKSYPFQMRRIDSSITEKSARQ